MLLHVYVRLSAQALLSPDQAEHAAAQLIAEEQAEAEAQAERQRMAVRHGGASGNANSIRKRGRGIGSQYSGAASQPVSQHAQDSEPGPGQQEHLAVNSLAGAMSALVVDGSPAMSPSTGLTEPSAQVHHGVRRTDAAADDEQEVIQPRSEDAVAAPRASPAAAASPTSPHQPQSTLTTSSSSPRPPTGQEAGQGLPTQLAGPSRPPIITPVINRTPLGFLRPDSHLMARGWVGRNVPLELGPVSEAATPDRAPQSTAGRRGAG